MMPSLLVGIAVAATPIWRTIGTGMSQAKLTATETTLFEHNATGLAHMNHFWVAGSPSVDNSKVRYYIDGESVPSIAFTPSLACGVGFDDQSAPWGTKWLGKGAKSTGWFHNIMIPFKTLRITFQRAATEADGTVWMIVRGIEGAPVQVGSLTLPEQARLQLQVTNTTLQPLEFVDVASVPSPASGLIFLHSMAVASGNYNFMEGCYHLFSPASTEWPGQLLSTGV